MPVWVALMGTLGYNVWRHKHGRSTLCSSTRTKVPPHVFDAGWAVLSVWLTNHYRDGYPRR